MFSTFSTILLIAALLLGGGGATAVAAQTAEPDGALYPVKVWSEEVRFDLARTDQNRLELALQFANRRMAEIQNQLAAGEAPDADHRIVFMRPHLARSIARVIGIVLASMLLIGSVVLFLGRLLGQGEAS